jgi:hypothetical protein
MFTKMIISGTAINIFVRIVYNTCDYGTIMDLF